MNLSKRLEKLEQAQDVDSYNGLAILISDLYDEGADAAIERWKAENGPVADNTFFIVMVNL
ncbi:hypothetical protein [Methylomonas rhizoryzae]|uniref:hypothetical protein n=1 Tax=Methylomonas rhizoryzae TaxID=2608981 RepID=UPI0012326824|nr:hypothetical protein [Methylomonas rhizoryzae]